MKGAIAANIRRIMKLRMESTVAPFIGWLNDMYSLQIALLVSAGIILIPGGVLLGLQFRKNNH